MLGIDRIDNRKRMRLEEFMYIKYNISIDNNNIRCFLKKKNNNQKRREEKRIFLMPNLPVLCRDVLCVLVLEREMEERLLCSFLLDYSPSGRAMGWLKWVGQFIRNYKYIDTTKPRNQLHAPRTWPYMLSCNNSVNVYFHWMV